MTYKGRIEKGAVILDEPVALPDGAVVEIDIVQMPEESDEKDMPTLAEALASVIGKAVGLPEDAAENHDHYLYGTPKR